MVNWFGVRSKPKYEQLLIQVEFRYLQVVTNAISGDRVTVGVLHWDGEQLRFGFSLHDIGSPHIQRSVLGIASRVRSRQEYHARGPSLFRADLDTIFKGDSRSGDSLVWSATRRGAATDTAGHFQELTAGLGLATAPRQTAKLSTPIFRDALAEIATEFAEFPGLVQARHEVVGHYSYRSPLSWRNGVWNHTIPVSFDVDTRAELEAHVREALARALTSIPTNDCAVLVAAVPSVSGPFAADAQTELAFIRSQVPTARAVEVYQQDGALRLDPLIATIRVDVAQHLGAGQR